MSTSRCIEAKWECPICGTKGRYWTAAYRARRNYAYHCKKYHGGETPTIILRKRRVRESQSKNSKMHSR